MGFDGAGKRDRRSETIAEHVVNAFLGHITTNATVDRFAADQLTLFAVLAEGRSRYVIPEMIGHLEANLWLVQKILGAGAEVQGNEVTIHGICFTRN